MNNKNKISLNVVSEEHKSSEREKKQITKFSTQSFKAIKKIEAELDTKLAHAKNQMKKIKLMENKIEKELKAFEETIKAK